MSNLALGFIFMWMIGCLIDLRKMTKEKSKNPFEKMFLGLTIFISGVFVLVVLIERIGFLINLLLKSTWRINENHR
jgi:hypothetical protein